VGPLNSHEGGEKKKRNHPTYVTSFLLYKRLLRSKGPRKRPQGKKRKGEKEKTALLPLSAPPPRAAREACIPAGSFLLQTCEEKGGKEGKGGGKFRQREFFPSIPVPLLWLMGEAAMVRWRRGEEEKKKGERRRKEHDHRNRTFPLIQGVEEFPVAGNGYIQ